MYDLREFIDKAYDAIGKHNIGQVGKYRRWLKQDEKNSRDMEASVYGASLATDIYYTLGGIPETEREGLIREIKAYQDPLDGLFKYEGSVVCHTTAFAAGALELLDAVPDYKAEGFSEYITKDGIYAFMDKIDWDNDPWLGAHWGAGIYGSMLLTGMSSDEWEDYYFDWLDKNEDMNNGLWMGKESKAPLFHYIAAAFHYVFNYEYAKRPIKEVDKILDTCIDAYNHNEECKMVFDRPGWPYIDFTYLLVHAQRRSGKRFEESQIIIKNLCDKLMNMILNENNKYDVFDDMNNFLAVISAIAVMQDVIPGYIKTSKPLSLILDRRPFI
ncbi:MAG: hypothetical protein K6E10_06565 [Eubacterium sp.]|nr:hypothetical protein [Eubacterium sp.]